MALYNVENIRNIVIAGHGSAGKTTLVDKFLTSTGTVNKMASVDNGSSICDFNEEEKDHKYTIESSLVNFTVNSTLYNIIDTPGYPDFIGQTISALPAVETVAIMVNAQAGVEANARRVFNEAKKLGLARMIIVNKLDGDHIDFKKVLADIQDSFGHVCVPVNLPNATGEGFSSVVSTLKVEPGVSAVIDPNEIHQPLLDSIIEVNEEVMERYFEGIQPTDEELSSLITEAVAKGSLVPVVCISAKTGVGVKELIDAFNTCALSPDKIVRTGKNQEKQDVQIKASDNQFVAQVFKTRIDPFVQRISYIRVFSGKLQKDGGVSTDESRRPVKIAQLFSVQASDLTPIPEVGPGYIFAVTKMDNFQTGTSLGDIILPSIKVPTPMVGLAVRPKARGDEAKLSGALTKICQEDPTFKLGHDSQTKELVMTGMSELHLQIIQEKLKRRNKVEVETKEPKIPYKETVRTKGEGSYRHKKQSGGHGQFGEVHIRMFPFPKDTVIEEFVTKDRFPQMREYTYDDKNNFLWINSIVGGTIPSNFLPAVEKGFKERIEKGVLAGYQIQDVCVEVFFGKYHPVDSSEASFKIAASMAFRNVFQTCQPAILEPVVKLEISIPAENVGDITSDMASRRGRVLGMDSSSGHFHTVTAEAPLAEVTTYARVLSSLTGGQGSYTLDFSHYDYVLPNIQQEIIAKAGIKEEEEEG